MLRDDVLNLLGSFFDNYNQSINNNNKQNKTFKCTLDGTTIIIKYT